MMNAIERSEEVVTWPVRKPPKITKRTSIKELKVHGKAHVNHAGKSLSEAAVGQDCRCKRLKCFENVNEDERKHIFTQFYALVSKNKQDAYIFSCISFSPVQRKRPRRQFTDESSKISDHNVAFEYKLRTNNKEKKVCHSAFLSILCITRSRLRRIQDIAVNKGTLPKDARGTHFNRPNKFPAKLANLVMLHIQSFKARQSHYSLRQNPNRMFLPETLNVKKMHKLFLQEYWIQITYKMYYNIFHSNFNIKFGLPRSDTCAVCDSLELKIAGAETDTVKKESLIKKELHLRKAAKFRELKKKYQLLAREGKCMVISFDYMQNLPLPHIKTGDSFYARQLWYYVFGIHDLADNSADMYVYTETMGKKGANEVTSMLLNYLKNKNITSDTVIFLSDGCAGQNKNHVMVYFQYILVHCLKLFKKIKHIFPIRGHSYMPNDQDFALIEKKKRMYCPEVPSDWDELITEARVSPSPFKVVKMRQEDFVDMKSCLVQYFLKSPRPTLALRKLRILEIKASSPLVYKKEQFHGMYTGCTVRNKKKLCDVIELKQLYFETLPLPVAKAQDLLRLSAFVNRPDSRAYYQRLCQKVLPSTSQNDIDIDEDDNSDACEQ